MKRRNTAIILSVLILLCSVTGLYLLHIRQKGESTPFPIIVGSGELLMESKEGYNSIAVYQQNNRLIINAKSEAAFFDGAQFIVDTQKKISPSDVEIIWRALGGKTETTKGNERIIAEIKIQESGEIIFNKKLNFAIKAFDAIEKNKK